MIFKNILHLTNIIQNCTLTELVGRSRLGLLNPVSRRLGLLGGADTSDELSTSEGPRSCEDGLRPMDRWLALRELMSGGLRLVSRLRRRPMACDAWQSRNLPAAMLMSELSRRILRLLELFDLNTSLLSLLARLSLGKRTGGFTTSYIATFYLEFEDFEQQKHCNYLLAKNLHNTIAFASTVNTIYSI